MSIERIVVYLATTVTVKKPQHFLYFVVKNNKQRNEYGAKKDRVSSSKFLSAAEGIDSLQLVFL